MKIHLLTFLLICTFSVYAQKESLYWKEPLLWADEFNGSGAPDSAKWGYNLGQSGWGNNEVQYYTNHLKNARQENGVLVIEAVKDAGEWTSARLISKGKFEFKYGRIVFRAKLPAGSGTWPALWLLGANNDKVGWPACGEIDIMEHIGRRPGKVQCALHTPASHGNTQYVGYTEVPDFSNEFHLYEAHWTPEKIDFSVDGKIYYTYNPGVRDESTWPYDHPFFIIMNIAMGGGLGSDQQYESGGLKNGIDPKLEKVSMEVDYVRVYKASE